MPQITLTLSLQETNLILEALGDLPYARVYELVNAIHRQTLTQVEPAAEPVVAPVAAGGAA
ncbi:hypothetical protein [Actinomadura bangladeshensis]|uniref:hypothetical protein n=1 Tax=Actinomadura bangladeshensis TaxID=453573 RepID=UPI001404DBFC|nr:hypothetical protein [Actinomadura bangladeshensis]